MGNISEIAGEKDRGYEVRVGIPVGVLSSSEGKEPTVGYEIYLLENERFSARGVYTRDSIDFLDEGKLVTHGPDGIEFALPLDKLGLKTPTPLRVLLVEFSHSGKEEEYSIRIFNLDAVQE